MSTHVIDWTLAPGETVRRVELHKRFGGRQQGGIAPSRKSNNVMVFTSPTGERYGYADGFQEDGCFHYTGEGQRGDQQMVSGNKALLQHVSEARIVRLFDGTGGEVCYVGAFQLDTDKPYYQADAPDVDGNIRKVIKFRLIPEKGARIDLLPTAAGIASPASRTKVRSIPTENHEMERFTTASITSGEAEKREAKLIRSYRAYCARKGIVDLQRLMIQPEGEAQALYTDLYSPSQSLAIEAKGSVAREAIRMAIGQLLDYCRFIPTPHRLAILVPEAPRTDLIGLLHGLGISVIHGGNDDGFTVLEAPIHHDTLN